MSATWLRLGQLLGMPVAVRKQDKTYNYPDGFKGEYEAQSSSYWVVGNCLNGGVVWVVAILKEAKMVKEGCSLTEELGTIFRLSGSQVLRLKDRLRPTTKPTTAQSLRSSSQQGRLQLLAVLF